MSVHAEPPPSIVAEPHGITYATANQLGKGGFAICYKAEQMEGDKPTGNIVALKIVKSKMEPAKLAQKFVTELQIHSKLSHPNIVGFHRAFSFQENTYVVLELCGSGSLADLLKKRKCATMPEIRRWMIQVCGAVKYLHTRNIVHRDLKTGNLFLDDQMNIKVGDFGLAALLVSGKDMDAKRRTTMCGTPNYLAPEILEKGKGHNEKVDLWAIGIISYTLAVGKAPFHAASKEEIYKKLKAGEYSWPELSSITNDISADLRDLVSKLLVPEEKRPTPDQIVSHPFFKVAFVPRKMHRQQTTHAPIWPVHAPSPEVLQRGYSDSWYTACEATGVGEYAPGRCFQLNGGQRIRSVVKDIEREIAAGKQPVIPIPADTVYTPLPVLVSQSNSTKALTQIVEEHDETISTKQLKELSNNEVPALSNNRRSAADVEAKRKRDAESMPPPPPRQRTDLTVRKTRSEVAVPTEARAAPETENLASAKPIRKPSVRSAAKVASEPIVEDQKSAEIMAPKTRSVDAALARRPKSIRRAASATTTESVESLPDSASGRVSTTRASRSKTKQADAAAQIEIFEEVGPELQTHDLVLPTAPSQEILAKPPVPQLTTSTSASVLPGSDPQTILHRVRLFQANLQDALRGKRTRPTNFSSRDLPQLPFVCRWVDYSRKHGVGYVLEDGTVGFIASKPDPSNASVMHVAGRNGERWLQRIGQKLENLDKVPLHILEDQEEGVGRVRSLHSSEEQRNRVKTMRVMWVKFGKYMCNSLSSQEDAEAAERASMTGDLQFVRFYQRMGTVGIWMFADGCIQLHFPDHTKLVLAPDATYISATLVTEDGIASIRDTHEISNTLIRDRQVMVHSTDTFLRFARSSSTSDATVRLFKANMLAEKLVFLSEVVDQWLSAGGVGYSSSGDPKLTWTEQWVTSLAKADWTTVGRWATA